jgi:hypothetical protein
MLAKGWGMVIREYTKNKNIPIRSLRNVGSEKCDTATFIDLTFRSRHHIQQRCHRASLEIPTAPAGIRGSVTRAPRSQRKVIGWECGATNQVVSGYRRRNLHKTYISSSPVRPGEFLLVNPLVIVIYDLSYRCFGA